MSDAQTLPAMLRASGSLSRTLRITLLVGLILSAGFVWLSRAYFYNAFTDDLRNGAQLRSVSFAGNIVGVLARHRTIPASIAYDRELIDALDRQNFATTSQRLIALQEELEVKGLFLLDLDGRMVAASNRYELASSHNEAPYFLTALRESSTVFTTVGIPEQNVSFYFSRRLEDASGPLGVIVVEVDLHAQELTWAGGKDQVIVTNSQDVIILASEREWRSRLLGPFLEELSQPIRRYSQIAGIPILPQELSEGGRSVTIDGQSFLRAETKIGFRNWTLSYLAPLADVDARVNAIVALEIMVLALIAALIFYLASRRMARLSLFFERESTELRALNARLASEIEERRRVEKNLEAAELSLVQASKLAALGQMSAAISHELNQPLAAMKTYLAGARLLVQRKRVEESLSSFQRVDDLINRMAVITSQLKSFARKGEQELRQIDLRDTVNSALSMMSPQLGQTRVQIEKHLPAHPVWVRGDAVRLEQIVINLLRNALDAMQGQADKALQIKILHGEMCLLQVRDNGPGIGGEAKSLFEPFYTTKKPGEGVGLGLAISAGIATDLGGELSAHNADDGGAVFELSLPAYHRTETAAE
ncbi:MAG: ATP-binding protein [Pseudomonadota bacterium]